MLRRTSACRSRLEVQGSGFRTTLWKHRPTSDDKSGVLDYHSMLEGRTRSPPSAGYLCPYHEPCARAPPQVKLAAWAAVIVCLSGVANLPTKNYDSKNLTYAAMCALTAAQTMLLSRKLSGRQRLGVKLYISGACLPHLCCHACWLRRPDESLPIFRTVALSWRCPVHSLFQHGSERIEHSAARDCEIPC